MGASWPPNAKQPSVEAEVSMSDNMSCERHRCSCKGRPHLWQRAGPRAAGVLDGGQRVDHAPGHASGDRADGLPERLQLLRVCSAAAFFRNNAILGTMQY